MFKTVKIKARKEVVDSYNERVKWAKASCRPLPKKPNEIQWDGRTAELLGTWVGNGSNYSAIKFPEHGEYEYELCSPELIRYSDQN